LKFEFIWDLVLCALNFVNANWKKLLWGIVFASFLLSLTHSFYFQIEPSVDAGAYDRIAVNILNGHGYRQNFDLPFEKDNSIGRVGPGYEFFLVGVYFIFGHHYEVVWFLQAIFHALSVLLVFLIMRKVGPSAEGPTLNVRAAALIAAVIFGFYPDLIIGSSMLLAETLAIFLMLLSIFIFFRILDKSGIKLAALLGFVFAASVLVRTPLLLIFLPFIYFFYKKKLFISLAIFTAVILAVMTPWTIRNFKVYGAFIPTSLTFGDDLLSGNHPGSSGELDDSRIQFTAKYNDYDMVTGDRLAAKEAIIFILFNPLEFIKITFFRISMYFSFARPTGWWPYLFGSPWQAVVLSLSSLWSVIIFTFGFYGIVEAIWSSKKGMPSTGSGNKLFPERSEAKSKDLPYTFFTTNKMWLLAFLAAVVLPVVFIVVETRYRYPSYAFFAIFAGVGIMEAIKFIKNGQYKNLKILFLVFIILFGNTIFDVVRNFDRIFEKISGLI